MVTAEIKNTGSSDLELAVDKGWGLVLNGYSGTPPNAKPILIFPNYCTAACDADDPCPKCEQPDSATAESKLEQRIVIPAGKSHNVEWDGKVHIYQKGAGKRCQCFTKAPVPPETYTLQSCGFRITKSAGSRTQLQCIKQQVKLPADKPTRLTFEFPALPPK
jgi:hypothetical protein